MTTQIKPTGMYFHKENAIKTRGISAKLESLGARASNADFLSPRPSLDSNHETLLLRRILLDLLSHRA
jgi:hypothetical protein